MDKFRMDGDGGIPLWEQFHILDGYFVGDSLKFEAHRLGRTEKVFPEGLFLTAKSGQRQPCCEVYGTLSLFSALFNLFGDSGKGKQVVVVVLHLVPQDGLPARPAHEKLPAVLQRVLQGVGFMAVNSDTGWERKMPGFDGVIAVVYADVHDFAHPFLAIVENLEGLLVLSKLAGGNPVREQVLFFPSQVSNLGGESVREGEAKSRCEKPARRLAGEVLKKGALPPCILRA